ncbi:hypothetical protein VB773_03390 [Haloarculaceae archaeon H-GB2-1]|nr:hypothetical protein [Haloarculaceae archaeon H-GB1-1]MEA5406719.1 hypothetical protein [Haloarculaceae archaeon H-GB2-1]
MSQQQPQQDEAPFVARTLGSGTRKEAADANEVLAFYRRQSRTAGEDVEWTFADHPAVTAAPDEGDLATVVRELDAHFENGVPIGIIAAALSKQGDTIGDTMDAIHDLRMTGGLWEPRDDHLRAF